MYKGQVGDLQLRRTIVLVVGQLLFADAGQVPKDDSSVIAAASQDAGFCGMPGKRCYRIIVALEGMHLILDVSEIPDANRLVGGSCGNKHLRLGIEGQRIDGIQVATLCDESGLVSLGRSQINDLQSLIV